MKADSTVKKELRRLRAFIDSPGEDELAKRIAWEVEHAIRWAREDVKGWPNPLASAANCADLVRSQIKSGDIWV